MNSVPKWVRHKQLWFFVTRAGYSALNVSVVTLLGLAIVLHILPLLGIGIPQLWVYVALGLGVVGIIVFRTITLFLRVPFSQFLISLDQKLQWGEKLATWNDLHRVENPSLVGQLFLFRLEQDISNLNSKGLLPRFRLSWQPYAMVSAGLLYFLLWAPGKGSALESSWENGEDHLVFKEKEILTPSFPLSSGKVPSHPNGETENEASPIPDEPLKNFELIPKFVPAQRLSGPTALKEVFLYDLPTGEKREESSGGLSSFAENYPELRKVAEEAIRRDRLDPEEAAFVMKYFDKIRPRNEDETNISK